MPTPAQKASYNEAFAHHAEAMGNLMREAGEHIAANSQLDLSPGDLVHHIEDIKRMLLEASYHAERMRVYDNLAKGRNAVPRSGVDIQ